MRVGVSSARAFRGGVTRSMLRVGRDFREVGPRADRASSRAKARFPIDPRAETTSRPSLRRVWRGYSGTYLEGRGGGSESSHFLQKWRVVTCVCVKSARGIAPRTASLLPVRVFASCATQRAPSLSIFILFFSYGASVWKTANYPRKSLFTLCLFSPVSLSQSESSRLQVPRRILRIKELFGSCPRRQDCFSRNC